MGIVEYELERINDNEGKFKFSVSHFMKFNRKMMKLETHNFSGDEKTNATLFNDPNHSSTKKINFITSFGQITMSTMSQPER